jgi:hypothetical protein
MQGKDARYTDNLEPCRENHCIFVTQCGHTGLKPCETQAGGILAVLYVDPSCTLLRPNGEWFEFIGMAYAHGIMNGELVRQLDEDGSILNERKFVLC